MNCWHSSGKNAAWKAVQPKPGVRPDSKHRPTQLPKSRSALNEPSEFGLAITLSPLARRRFLKHPQQLVFGIGISSSPRYAETEPGA